MMDHLRRRITIEHIYMLNRVLILLFCIVHRKRGKRGLRL